MRGVHPRGAVIPARRRIPVLAGLRKMTRRIVQKFLYGAAAFICLICTGGNLAIAAPQSLKLELNKLEPRTNACRAYFVIENKSGAAYTGLKLDLVIFNGDGIVANRLAVETAPLPANKTRLKVFDIQGAGCSAISRVLLNDVLACETGGQPANNCLASIETGSRTATKFFK